MDPGLSPYGQEFPVPRHSEATKSAIKDRWTLSPWSASTCHLRRVGSKYKALCPFHDDHNPSLELNPERQSFKCWSCGVGGDVFDFVKNIRARGISRGVAHAGRSSRGSPGEPRRPGRRLVGPSKTELWPCSRGRRRCFAELSVAAPGSRLSCEPGVNAAEHRAVSSWLCSAGARLAAVRGAAKAFQH